MPPLRMLQIFPRHCRWSSQDALLFVCFHGEMIVVYHLRHFSETVTAKLTVHEFSQYFVPTVTHLIEISLRFQSSLEFFRGFLPPWQYVKVVLHVPGKSKESQLYNFVQTETAYSHVGGGEGVKRKILSARTMHKINGQCICSCRIYIHLCIQTEITLLKNCSLYQ